VRPHRPVLVFAALAGVGPFAVVAAALQAPVTFTRDVAPIVFTSCAACHRPDGSAPFSLLTYVHAKAHADRIVEVTAARTMPAVEAGARTW